MTKYDLIKSKIERYISTLSKSACAKVNSKHEAAILRVVANDLFDIIQATDNVDPKLLTKEEE